MNLIRLLYCSQAAATTSAKDVQKILQSARRNNPANGLTGVLVYGGRMFMQVLEGPESAVLRQYVKILDDNRHSDCSIIFITPTGERMYKDWSMGFIECDPLEFPELNDWRSRRLETINTHVFTDTTREFLKRLRSGQ